MRAFRRQQTRQQMVAAPPPSTPRVWVAAAYGPQVDTLVSRLAVLMEAATAEALMPTTSPSAGSPDRPQNSRQLLWNDLKDLQSVLIRTDVSDDDVDRDRRLRAAVSTAVGAACNLALASTSQPTAGYLGLTRTAVDGVLDAAGRRTLA